MSRLPSPAVTQRVAVVQRQGQLAVVATAPHAAGDVVLAVSGRIVATPSRHTLQIGRAAHVDAELDEAGRYPPWRFVNHGCAANTTLVGQNLVALRPIAVGDEVTFDYETTEWDMAAPFVCACGSAACRGFVSGYRHLSASSRRTLLSPIASHLHDA